MYLNKQITGYLERASWIRKMFEKGRELKQNMARTGSMILAWVILTYLHLQEL